MAEQSYGFGITLAVPYAEAVEKVTEALQTEGFGVLTTIDVQATLKHKLAVEHRPYTILGVCNPPLAYRALQAEPAIGLLLPCNVIVYEGEHAHETVVSIIDPLAMLQMSENATLAEVATEAQTRLKNVIAALA